MPLMSVIFDFGTIYYDCKYSPHVQKKHPYINRKLI